MATSTMNVSIKPCYGFSGHTAVQYPLPAPHARPAEEILAGLHGSSNGLSHAEAVTRLLHYGPNALPAAEPPGIAHVFLHQFVSPLIYVLVAAALVSLAIREWSDAGFICAVLLLNSIIGTAQEYSAQRAAKALQLLVTTRSRVLREGDIHDLDAEDLVPGDVVLLESGERVPADMRLLVSHGLEVDESLLTGESVAVFKRTDELSLLESPLGNRVNMAFAGTLVSRGRRSCWAGCARRRCWPTRGSSRIVITVGRGAAMPLMLPCW